MPHKFGFASTTHPGYQIIAISCANTFVKFNKTYEEKVCLYTSVETNISIFGYSFVI